MFFFLYLFILLNKYYLLLFIYTSWCKVKTFQHMQHKKIEHEERLQVETSKKTQLYKKNMRLRSFMNREGICIPPDMAESNLQSTGLHSSAPWCVFQKALPSVTLHGNLTILWHHLHHSMAFAFQIQNSFLDFLTIMIGCLRVL